MHCHAFIVRLSSHMWVLTPFAGHMFTSHTKYGLNQPYE